ncbi:hypothetical protein K9U39_09840 [Rhodoblastus acidophilus]|uniref:Glycosyl transferase CAP10 domain-containing protein n=1 Tax=Candidatus Rhodoblastus alkanivorans TaxID=2954117 RepID=A0ABS9ZBA7_9HYPH|nr:glycosyl transferase family 90 [Candidatus Rhodoblastus alkanivorans]MCI4679472.1 hypothetical protein [Candidatus Rhodoblastus alkanivorans]MCI4683917.1 hypothetical protein [Candidatus Rhodoblastus alkanivorans]MDI4641236.1 hypothetical protein [Rhodoblastus acidophilus]
MIKFEPSLAAILDGRLGDAWDGSIQLVKSEETGQPSIINWEPAKRRVILHRTIRESHHFKYFASKIQPTLRVLEEVYSQTPLQLTSTIIQLNLDDIPSPKGVAFVSGDGGDNFLIPDPNFIRTEAYAALKAAYANVIPWQERLPVVFWRGGTSGRQLGRSWRELPRIRLCQIALRDPKLDAGITHVAQLPEGASGEISAEGLIRGRVPAELFRYYRALLAIDGNSWPTGFYCNLLAGAPVLKVESSFGYRQWYYHRLKPWVHYIPVQSDLTDLSEKAAWVLADGNRAEKIGMAGREAAMQMTVESEIQAAAETLTKVLHV